MAVETKIEWADSTANFWEGCTQISPGCDGCYAMTRAARYNSVEWNGPPRKVAAGHIVVRAMQRHASKPGTAAPFIFVNSLSDFFDNKADPAWRAEALNAMYAAPHCRFLILTKRVGNVESMIEKAIDWPVNAWLGASIVNQEEADRDVPKLIVAKDRLRIPRVFLSVEPMLGAVNLTNLRTRVDVATSLYGVNQGAANLDALRGWTKGAGHGYRMRDVPYVDWVICGGESGKHARPMHPDWARSLRDQCAAAGVPFMFKQWGEYVPCELALPSDEMSVVCVDGEHLTGKAAVESRWDDPNAEIIRRAGKVRAGRILDGVTHDGRPQP